MNKEVTFQIGIKKIKDIEFWVNENISVPTDFGLNISQHTNFIIPDKIIELIITIDFKTKDDEHFLHSKISNHFHLPDIEKFKNSEKPEEYNLPEALLYTILGLSISHSRALIAKNSSGTIFSDCYLPIVNPVEITRQLFKIG
jgi:hypothetical protein